jgi:hypothetical protein
VCSYTRRTIGIVGLPFLHESTRDFRVLATEEGLFHCDHSRERGEGERAEWAVD